MYRLNVNLNRLSPRADGYFDPWTKDRFCGNFTKNYDYCSFSQFTDIRSGIMIDTLLHLGNEFTALSGGTIALWKFTGGGVPPPPPPPLAPGLRGGKGHAGGWVQAKP